MPLKSLQAQILKFYHPYINQHVQMVAPVVKYVLSPFEGNINPGDKTGLKRYLQANVYIDKENDKIYITVSNSKDIIDHFLSVANKYVWGCLAFMVETTNGPKNIFRVVEYIQLVDIQNNHMDVLD